ncbi:hypothetical protein KQI52_11580 [bacterium]|nr:hypothetical protein [bacterium]
MNRIAVVSVVLLGLLLAGCAPKQEAETYPLGQVSLYEATYELSPTDHMLDAQVNLTWTPARIDTFFFLLHKDLNIGEARAEGDVQQGELLLLGSGHEAVGKQMGRLLNDSDWNESNDHLALYGIPVSATGDVSLTFSYCGPINDDVEVASFNRWAIADESTGLIEEKGAFLVPTTGYYPFLPGDAGLSKFETTILHPEDWEGLAEGNISAHTDTSVHFSSVHPLDGMYLVAGPYLLDTIEQDGTEIAMYHYEDDSELVDRYLTHSARYIAMYNEMIGPYQFDRFSVVENWFPTGYGMPSYTLLGTDVLALPFIVYTSLGHEVLHNWWGNGVLVDYDTGNWCEGLTVYQADYIYAGQRDPSGQRQYRLDLLRDYSDYVIRGEDDDFPLREFTSRTTAGSRTIGYGKVMMVYHMVANRIGPDVFTQALSDFYMEHQFEKVAWADFFDKFEAVSGEDFGWYEQQWIDRPGAPAFDVQNPLVQQNTGEANYLLEFDLVQTQGGDPFRLDLPVRVHFASGSSVDHVLRDVNGEMYHARVPAEERPVRFDIDPDYNVFRVLDPLEAPPTLSGFYGAEQPIVVLPPQSDPMRNAYEQFAGTMLARTEAEFVEAEDVTDELLAERSVLRLGREQASERVLMTGSLQDSPPSREGLALVWASRNNDHPNVVHMDVWASSAGALGPLARKLPHYGKYSYLAFTAGENIAKGQWDVTESPLIVALP